MHILLAAATEAEIAPAAVYLKEHWTQAGASGYSSGQHELSLLISGVGMMATAYHLSKVITRKCPDLALLAGIAGSFDRDIPLGAVVQVCTEALGDLGAEDGYQFQDVFALQLADPDAFPFRQGVLPAPEIPGMRSLRRVSSITVNTVSGTSFTAIARQKHYYCQVENMEGAAFHYVCLKEQVPFAQIRAISNYVEARDRSRWQIPQAIDALNDYLIGFLKAL